MRLDIANIASMVGDFDLAEEQLRCVSGAEFNLHGRCDELATGVFVRAMQEMKCDPHALVELDSLNNRLRDRPGQELATIALAMGRCQQGQSELAIATVDEYLTKTRRELYPSRNPITVSFARGIPLVEPNEIRRRAGCLGGRDSVAAI
jgi:hypothetical protein